MFYPHTIKGKPFPRLDLIPGVEPDPICLLPTNNYYRIHGGGTAFDPNVTIENTVALIYTSSTVGIAHNLTLFQVCKDDIEGTKLYIDWEINPAVNSSNLTRKITLYDGHIKGDDSQFITGQPVPTGLDILTHAATDNARYQESIAVPNLSTFSNSITIMITLADFWTAQPMTGTITDFQIREINNDIIKEFNLLGTITETGDDGVSSFGTLAL